MKKYLYLIKNSKIPTYLKYWLMYSSKKISLLIQSLPITLENTIKDLKIIINKIYGNTIQDGTPSPENPVAIQNVTGDVEVKVQNKNLFDKNNPNVYNGYFTPSSPIMTSNANHRTIYVSIKPNTIYTIQKSNVGGDNCRFGIGTTTTIPTTGVSVSQVALNNSATTQTITTNQSAKYLVVWCYFTSNTSITENELYASIQIEQGSTPSTYTPHSEQNYPISLGDIELCKIGEYQDYIYKENGNWYKYGAIEKVVLDGSESGWANGYLNNKGLGTITVDLDNPVYESNDSGICNYFIYKWIYNNPTPCFYVYNNNNIGRIMFITNFQTKTEFMAWLSTHNTIVYYVLATPTTTQITDTTLINQLNALEDAYTYEDVTNISSNQNIYLDIDYIKRG